MRGGKKTTTIKYHTHRTLHMSTTSRDAIPRGENKNKNQSPHPPRQLRLNGPKNIITHDFNTQPSSLRSPPPPPPPTPPNDGPHIVRREQVGFYTIHTHTQPYTLYPGLFTAQERTLPLTRNSEGFTNTPSSQSFKSQFPQSKYLSSPFTYFTVLPVRLRGKGQTRGFTGILGYPSSTFHIFSFHFSSRLSLISS